MIRTIDRKLCSDCGLCYRICPLDVFSQLGGMTFINYSEDCMTCFVCESMCPEGAIFVGPERSGEKVLSF